MLSELAAIADENKLADWTASLGDRNAKNSLPAEVELAICWAANKAHKIEVAPDWWGGSKPDLFVENLCSGCDAIIDITCTGDVNNEQEKLNAAAVKILDVIRARNSRRARGAYITFLPQRGYESGHYRNRLRVPNGALSDEAASRIHAWADGSGASSVISTSDLFARLEFFDRGMAGRQFRSGLLSGWETPDRNAVYRALDEKRDQLRNEHFEGLRGVVLVDLGSRSLSRGILRTWEPLYEYEDAIAHFFADKPDGLDFVLVLTAGEHPKSRTIFGSHLSTSLGWRGRVLSRDVGAEVQRSLIRIVEALPTPKVSSYRVGEMLRAGSKFGKYREANSHLRSIFESGYMKPLTVKISAKALLHFLSGRISESAFRSEVGDFSQIVSKIVSSGGEIASAHFQSGGIDEDDDYVCFTIEPGLTFPPQGERTK